MLLCSGFDWGDWVSMGVVSTQTDPALADTYKAIYKILRDLVLYASYWDKDNVMGSIKKSVHFI